jgi:hypothetical protein
VEGSYEHGDEPSGSLKCLDVPESLHNWQLLRKGLASTVGLFLCYSRKYNAVSFYARDAFLNTSHNLGQIFS